MHGGHHAAVKQVAGLMNARRVHQNDLAFGARDDALNLIARRLRLVRHGRDLLADEPIQERGLARVRSPDQRDIAAAIRRVLNFRLFLHVRLCASACPTRLSHDANVCAVAAGADNLTHLRWLSRE